mmetsp:Transcript_6411/g.5510  ORF Transcript_6411/g.5510 Transcript_6411/m.5510 type:complete len:170 (+) Transcript_6411:3-512(+)
MNDGHHLWKSFNLKKNEDGKYLVSHRFVDRSLLNKKIVNVKALKAIDLLPFPQRIPYANFNNLVVAFTLFSRDRDLPVLENLADLMGMKIEFSQENTTHLVYCSYDTKQGPGGDEIENTDFSRSHKIQTIKRTFGDKTPHIVSFDWFLNCMLNGEKIDEGKYSQDINLL